MYLCLGCRFCIFLRFFWIFGNVPKVWSFLFDHFFRTLQKRKCIAWYYTHDVCDHTAQPFSTVCQLCENTFSAYYHLAVSSIPTSYQVYLIQLHVVKCVTALWKIGGFFQNVLSSIITCVKSNCYYLNHNIFTGNPKLC